MVEYRLFFYTPHGDELDDDGNYKEYWKYIRSYSNLDIALDELRRGNAKLKEKTKYCWFELHTFRDGIAMNEKYA